MQSLLPPESVPLVDDAEWFVGLPLPAALVLVHNCEYAQALADPRLGADGVRSVCTRAHVPADARACLHKLMTEAEVAAGVSPDQCQCCYMQLLVHTTFLKSGRPQHRVKTNLIRLNEKGMLPSTQSKSFEAASQEVFAAVQRCGECQACSEAAHCRGFEEASWEARTEPRLQANGNLQGLQPFCTLGWHAPAFAAGDLQSTLLKVQGMHARRARTPSKQ